MNKVLVTGAAGFVGRVLCAELTRKGFSVRGAVRGPKHAAGPCCAEVICTGDLGPATCWNTALLGIETVIHLAARVHVMDEQAVDPLAEFRRVNVAATRALAEASAGRVRRFVYVSSVHAMSRGSEKVLNEDDHCLPDTPYGASKWEAEQTLRDLNDARGLEVVIVRPAPVYGPGGAGNLARLLRLAERGWPLPLGGLTARRSLVYVGNLADALVRCAAHPAAANQTYLVSDGEDLSVEQLVARAIATLERPARLWPAPLNAMRLAGRLLGRSAAMERLTASLVVSSARIRRHLDWTPPFTLDQGLKATMEAFQANASPASVAA